MGKTCMLRSHDTGWIPYKMACFYRGSYIAIQDNVGMYIYVLIYTHVHVQK